MRTELGIYFPWGTLMTWLGPSGMGSGLYRMWDDPEGPSLALPFLYEVMGQLPPIDTQQRANEKGWLVSRSQTDLVWVQELPPNSPPGASRDKAFISLRLLAH